MPGPTRRAMSAPVSLQWGRGLGAAECDPERGARARDVVPSMGPRLRSRGMMATRALILYFRLGVSFNGAAA